jgi:heat shock protein HslJ
MGHVSWDIGLSSTRTAWRRAASAIVAGLCVLATATACVIPPPKPPPGTGPVGPPGTGPVGPPGTGPVGPPGTGPVGPPGTGPVGPPGTPPPTPLGLVCRPAAFDRAVIERSTGADPSRWQLTVSGMNTGPTPFPAAFTYVHQPEYWAFELRACDAPGDAHPQVITPFVVTRDLTGFTGTKGVELISGSRTQRLDVPPPPSAPKTLLDGTSWELDGYQIGSTSVPVSRIVTASFSATEVSGQAPCNTYHASYRALAQGITVGPIVTTKADCAPGVAEAEAAFLARLAAVTELELESHVQRLTLTGGSGSLQFRRGPTTVSTLVGSWRVIFAHDGAAETPSSFFSWNLPLEFRADGTLAGEACGPYRARWMAKVPSLRITDLRPRIDEECTWPDPEQLDLLWTALRTATIWRIDHRDRLELYTADGRLVLLAERFRPPSG